MALSPTHRPGAHPPARPPSSDTELVRRVLLREAVAIEEFVQRMRCVPRILAALNARMGRPLNEHDLADLAQDTAVLAWRKIETFGDQGTLETWAYGIARLEFMNAKRRHGREGRRHERFEAAAHADARDAGPEQLHDEIEAMLMRIAPEEAQLVRLKHLAGLTFEEIGRRLGIPGNTAKTRYYRGLRSLQGLFGGQLAEGPG